MPRRHPRPEAAPAAPVDKTRHRARVYHRKPHKGNIELFFDTRNWQALCAPCHDRHAQSEEKTGKAIPRRGPDGWPLPPE
jgi:cytochrome c553